METGFLTTASVAGCPPEKLAAPGEKRFADGNSVLLGYHGHVSESGSQVPQHVLDSAAELDRMAEASGNGEGPLVIIEDSGTDKYALPSPVEIDCEARIPLCKAACCRLNAALSWQDIEEGVLVWDQDTPYLNAHDADGYCVHLKRPESRCSVYSQRPAVCRVYDCRNDQRIWVDFEKRIPNPALEELSAIPLAGASQPDDGAAEDLA